MSIPAEKLFESRVILLAGDEDALRRRALGELLEIATKDDDFDLQTFEADESTPTDWIASAGTAPFLSERRTVVGRHILRVDEVEGVAAQLKLLPPSALLILVADEENGDEGKQRKLGTARKSWEKAVKVGEGVVADFATNPKQIQEAIRNEAARLGKKMSIAGATSLAEMTGGSLSRSVEELEKLAIFVGEESNIREADIHALVMPAREWQIFKLVDAIVEGAIQDGLRQLRIMVGSQTKAEDAAFSRIFPMLNRQLRLMWQARVCLEARCTPDSAPPEIRRLFPEKPNIAKEAPYRQSRLMQQARRVDFDALSRSFQAVSDADAKLKGMLGSFNAIDTLEQMLLDMSSVMSPRPGVRSG